MFRSVILRFVLPLALASCVVAYLGLPYIQRLLAEWFSADVEVRAQLVMHSVEAPIAELVAQGNEARLRSYLARMTADERLLAVLVCRPDGTTIARSERAPHAITLRAERQGDAVLRGHRAAAFRLGAGVALRLRRGEPTPYRVVMLSDLELRRPPPTHGARFRAGVPRHRRAAARACWSCWSRGCSCAAG